jgi:hypothetical protein
MSTENQKNEPRDSWLASLKKTTRDAYKVAFRYFEEYTKLSSDEILAERKQHLSDNVWQSKVLAFKEWLATTKNLGEYSTTASAMAIRGFFNYHNVPLVFNRGMAQRCKERSRKTEDYRFTLDDIRKMVNVGNLQEKYVLLAGKSFGIRGGDFLRLTRGKLETGINGEVPISIGEIGTEKEHIVAFPFIDADAKPVILGMLAQMTSEGRTGPNERMLTLKNEVELNRNIQRMAKRAGINNGEKRIRFHCVRKFLIDRLASIMSESKWKLIVGKKISEGAYVTTEGLHDDYARVMETTCITLRTTTLPKEVQDQIEELQRKQREIEQKYGVRLRQSSKRKQKTCDDGKHCQQIVSEEKLGDLLAEGWKVVAALQSGKVVVSNEE